MDHISSIECISNVESILLNQHYTEKINVTSWTAQEDHNVNWIFSTSAILDICIACEYHCEYHFEDIWTSNTHNINMIVKNCTCPKLNFTHPKRVDRWLGRTLLCVLKLCCMHLHYIDVVMTTMASQITSLAVVYSSVYLDTDQRKHQSSASLAFVWGIHRDRWIPRTKGQLRGKCFHLMTSSWDGHLDSHCLLLGTLHS